MLLDDSDVMVTVTLYICETQISCDEFDTSSPWAQNNRVEVCAMQGQACKLVNTTNGTTREPSFSLLLSNMAGINLSSVF